MADLWLYLCKIKMLSVTIIILNWYFVSLVDFRKLFLCFVSIWWVKPFSTKFYNYNVYPIFEILVYTYLLFLAVIHYIFINKICLQFSFYVFTWKFWWIHPHKLLLTILSVVICSLPENIKVGKVLPHLCTLYSDIFSKEKPTKWRL